VIRRRALRRNVRITHTNLEELDWAAYGSPPLFGSGSGVSSARMRGSDIGGGFLLPVLRRQVSLIRSGFGVGSGLRFIRNTPSHSTFPTSAI
jgi:hypothetical protein